MHTFGGGTWTSEFALETGLADVLFGNAGLYATYSLAPRVQYSLPRAFKAAGYRVIAVYSHSGEFLNARNAYENYGFDMFYDGTDLGLGWESTDEDLYEAFRQIYSDEVEAHPDQSLFVFTLSLHRCSRASSSHPRWMPGSISTSAITCTAQNSQARCWTRCKHCFGAADAPRC